MMALPAQEAKSEVHSQFHSFSSLTREQYVECRVWQMVGNNKSILFCPSFITQWSAAVGWPFHSNQRVIEKQYNCSNKQTTNRERQQRNNDQQQTQLLFNSPCWTQMMDLRTTITAKYEPANTFYCNIVGYQVRSASFCPSLNIPTYLGRQLFY